MFTHLIKTIVLNVIRKAIIIPKAIDIDDDDDDEMPFLFSIDGNDNERDEHRASIENIFGGGPIANIGGGGGNWEQR
jgi:hypothetical protein